MRGVCKSFSSWCTSLGVREDVKTPKRGRAFTLLCSCDHIILGTHYISHMRARLQAQPDDARPSHKKDEARRLQMHNHRAVWLRNDREVTKRTLSLAPSRTPRREGEEDRDIKKGARESHARGDEESDGCAPASGEFYGGAGSGHARLFGDSPHRLFSPPCPRRPPIRLRDLRDKRMRTRRAACIQAGRTAWAEQRADSAVVRATRLQRIGKGSRTRSAWWSRWAPPW